MTSNYVFPLNQNQSDVIGAIRNLEACIKDVAVWMNSHSLKLNNEKTEFVLFGSKVNLSKIDINSIVIPDTVIGVSDSCRNLGVMLDSTMTMSSQISSIMSVRMAPTAKPRLHTTQISDAICCGENSSCVNFIPLGFWQCTPV